MKRPAKKIRSDLKMLPPGKRLEIEKLLAKGITPSQAARLTKVVRAIVMSVQESPIPGGPLELAGQKIPADQRRMLAQIISLANRKPGVPIEIIPVAATKITTANATTAAIADAETPVMVKGQTGNTPTTPGKNGGAEFPPMIAPETGKGASPSPLFHAPAPTVRHSGMDDDEPLPDSQEFATPATGKNPNARMNKTLRHARKLTNKYLPLDKRIQILAEIAKDKDAPANARLAAVEEVNRIDGIDRAVKDPASGAVGGGPLFQLPKGMGQVMSFAPVRPTATIAAPAPAPEPPPLPGSIDAGTEETDPVVS